MNLSKQEERSVFMENQSYESSFDRLKEGNEEYRNTHSNASLLTAEDRKYHVENGQHPFACIICCSDSRVVPEHIFSVGLGALFTIRTAGNTIGEREIGSVEYAVLHLHCPLVVVMGHTHCGAVSAAIDGHAEGSIKVITDKISEALSDKTDIRKCEWDNAEDGVTRLLNSPLLKEQANQDKVKILAAMYDTESGKVDFRD